MAELPSHVSHSQLTSWQRCGKAYQLGRLQGAPKTPAVWSFAGKAVHACIEQINIAFANNSDLDLNATWSQAWDETLAEEKSRSSVPVEQWRVGGRQSADKPNKEDTTWWYAEGLRQCAAYRTWLIKSGYTIHRIGDTVAAEIEVNGTFGGVAVKGYLDSILVDKPNDRLILTDYKSGTTVPTSYSQLSQYAATLKRTLGLEVTHGAYFMTRKTELTEPRNITLFTPEYFDSQFTQFRSGLEAGIFLPNPGQACFTCDVKSACFAVGGTDAWLYDPDHPQYTTQKETA